MDEQELKRTPKQGRSIQTKNKILRSAYHLFCEKGYFNTTTNEIAREAGVPIGSLYAYFVDKDTIFLDILKQYHEEFADSNAQMARQLQAYQGDVKAWIRKLIECLILIHERSKELNREIQILCYYNAQVAAQTQRQRQDSVEETKAAMRQMESLMRVVDFEAAAYVVFDTISAVVDRIAFGEYQIDRDRIIDACVDEVFAYLSK